MQIFLSYRRVDSSEFASQCFEYFSSRNGPRSIFWDKQSIPLDADWKDSIRENIDKADAVLCIVGPRWNELLRERRADPDDCVRFEIEYALDRRRPIVVVLINGASSPIADQLPDRLKSLAKLQAGAFNSATPIASFRLLDNRLQQFAPQVAAPRLLSQAAVAARPWVDRGLQSPSQHSSWWQLWNFHDEAVMGRITEVLSEQSGEAGVVLLAGPENSGRRYLIDAAVRRLRADGGTVQLLRINLDGYEPESADPLAAYLRFQAQRLGIRSGRGQRQNDLEQLIGWLKAELSGGVSSKATCASVGMLLELCGSFAGVLRLLRGVVLRAAVREHIRLLTCLLEFFCMQRRTIVHVEDSVVDQFLRDDLVSLCQSQPQLRLVLSSLPDVNPTTVLGYRPGIRIDVSRFDDHQLLQVLQSRFGPNDIPEWLLRLLRQETQGNRGLTARLLIDLFQDDVLQWDSQNNWFAAPPAAKAHAPASLRRLLQPLDRLFQDTPHLESLMRLAALCGELIPMTLLLDFLRVPVEEREDLMEVIDERLCDGAEAIPILADLGFSHPGFRVQRKINIYRFLCPLDRDLLLQGTTAAWQQQQAQALLEFLEIAMPESTRGLASLYLQLHEYLPDGQVACQALRERLQWWITEIEGERFRNYISKAINSGQLSGDAVWQAIQHNRGKGSAAMRLNLLLGYEQQKDGIPVENAGLFYSRKGRLLLDLAKFAEAEFYLREALRISEKADGPDHPTVATRLNNLAILLDATNRHSEAEPLYRRALSIDETSFGPDHPNVATCLNNLAELLHATNRHSEAEPLYRRALSIDETSYGFDHPNVARDLNNLAALLCATNRHSEAEPLYRRALSISETSYGPDHPNVARSLNNLANLLSATNRHSEAEPLYRRALSIYETSYGPDHPNVATGLNNLAELLRATNRVSEAEPLSRRAVEIFVLFTQRTGHVHPHLEAAVGNYMAILQSLGFDAAATESRLSELLKPLNPE